MVNLDCINKKYSKYVPLIILKNEINNTIINSYFMNTIEQSYKTNLIVCNHLHHPSSILEHAKNIFFSKSIRLNQINNHLLSLEDFKILTKVFSEELLLDSNNTVVDDATLVYLTEFYNSKLKKIPLCKKTFIVTISTFKTF